jgi:hypothetical protein
MEPSKKFLLVFIGTILILCSVTAAINIYSNPFGYYGDAQLGVGQVFNAQIEKLHHIESMEVKPDAFVFGSSNSMRMSPKLIDSLFQCRSYNYGVYQAGVADYYCIGHVILDDLKIKPKLVIVCVDDWSFAELPQPPDRVFYGAQNRLAYKPRFSKYLKDFSWLKLIWAQVKSSLSFDQLSFSLSNFYKAYQKKDFHRSPSPTYSPFFSDGTRMKYADLDDKDVTDLAESGKYKLTEYLKNKYDSLVKVNPNGAMLDGHEVFERFDKKSLNLFDSLMCAFTKAGTKVIINVMPVQPYYWQVISSKTNYNDRIVLLLKYLNGLKSKYNNIILVKDNHLIEDFNGLPDSFFDCFHPTYYNSAQMLYSIQRSLK